MGFLNFFNKKNKNANRETLEKAEIIKRKVFPGGDTQIKNETNEICSLLNNKYSFNKVKHIFSYSASVFLLSKDKSYETFASQILSKYSNDFTKDDSLTMYNYLVKKFKLDIITNIAKDLNKSFSVGDNLFHIATGATVELESNFKELSASGKFELIILNTILIASELRDSYSEKAQHLPDLFFNVIDEAKSLGISGSDEAIADYINTRTTFFQNELALFHQTEGYLLGKIYSCIYVSPLKVEPELSNNLIEIMRFTGGYTIMALWIKEQIRNM